MHYQNDLRRYYRLPAVQVSLTIVLSLFVTAIFIVFAISPTINSIVSLRKTISESNKTFAQLEKKVADLQKASIQLETLTAALPVLNASIPNNSAGYSPFYTSIEILASQTGTTLESESLGGTLLFSRLLAPFEASKNQSVVELPFSIRVNGGYPNISTFLSKFLSMERVVMIDSATITREAGPKSANTMVSLSVSGSAYYLADEAQLKESMPDLKGKK